MSAYRILVTGSRDWEDGEQIALSLGYAVGEALSRGVPFSDVVIVHGHCPTGADATVDRLASDYGHRVERHPAEWDRLGKSAGFQRNAVMVAAGADVCLAFIRNGSRGATHTADLARKAGIETRRYLA